MIRERWWWWEWDCEGEMMRMRWWYGWDGDDEGERVMMRIWNWSLWNVVRSLGSTLNIHVKAHFYFWPDLHDHSHIFVGFVLLFFHFIHLFVNSFVQSVHSFSQFMCSFTHSLMYLLTYWRSLIYESKTITDKKSIHFCSYKYLHHHLLIRDRRIIWVSEAVEPVSYTHLTLPTNHRV